MLVKPIKGRIKLDSIIHTLAAKGFRSNCHMMPQVGFFLFGTVHLKRRSIILNGCSFYILFLLLSCFNWFAVLTRAIVVKEERRGSLRTPALHLPEERKWEDVQIANRTTREHVRMDGVVRWDTSPPSAQPDMIARPRVSVSQRRWGRKRRQ